MNKLFKMFFILLLVILIGIVYYSYSFFTKPLLINNTSHFFELKKGESLGHLSLQLKSQGLIPATWPFKLYARLNGLDKKLQAGEYLIESDQNLLDLIQQLEKGSTLQRSVTFVEGWSYKQLFSALQQDQAITWQFDEPDFTDNLEIKKLGGDSNHLEGMFFADTYFYSKGESVNTLLNTSHNKLLKVLEAEWEGREDNLPLNSPYEALILASIVEKETGLASERPLIAGVFINRLRKGMRLQTDPTVIYGVGDAYQGNITRKHLKAYTPYNTYRISGLPPTPIAIVGRESINAVMHPKPSKYIYFVAKGNGSHYFSATLDEHQKAVDKYQRKRVGNYRSAPSQ